MLVVPRHPPKTLVKCGCRRILMHDHFLCPCINSSNVQGHRFMHHIMHISISVMHCFRFMACFFYKFCFILVFVNLTLFVLIFSVFKNSKTHKN